VQVQIVGAKVRLGLTGQMELSSVPLTKIVIVTPTDSQVRD